MSRGPLAGLKVLDFSTLLPGPYATQILADMGARVLRVESSSRPDLARLTPPFLKSGVSTIHAQINRNKDCISLNLKKEKCRDIIYKFVRDKGYDIVIEGFRPGVMDKLHLGYKNLSAINPSVIYCSITGYGQTGPFSSRAGHDINYLALSGLASYAGTPTSGPPLFSTQIADIAGGSHNAVMGVLAAVVERQAASLRNPKALAQGQHIDISMADAAFALNCMDGACSLFENVSPQAGEGMLHGGNACYGYYATKDGRFLSVGALEPQFATAFFEAIERPEWLHRLSDDVKQLRVDISDILLLRTQAEWVEVFSAIDCCVEPVLSVQEAAAHPQFQQREMTVMAEYPVSDGMAKVKQIAPAIKFRGKYSRGVERAGGVVGEHTMRVLAEELGMADELQQLIREDCL